jgi:hypothetical protein
MMTPAIIETIQAELRAALSAMGHVRACDAHIPQPFREHHVSRGGSARGTTAGTARAADRVSLSELSWIAALIADEVIATPRLLPDRDGLLLCSVPLNGSMRQVVAFEHKSGHEPVQSASLSTWFLKLGALTARLHGHGRLWKRTRARRDPSITPGYSRGKSSIRTRLQELYGRSHTAPVSHQKQPRKNATNTLDL